MRDAKKFAEAYNKIVNFIGYVAGIGVGIGGEIGKKLKMNAAEARFAAQIIRPPTAAEIDVLRYEQSEKMLKEEQIGKIMAIQE